ncbi:MAG: DUF3181 family protein [Kamptonema sp. SIO1D9]|nr:DUF3181 family protein [Kamptonema sp. SIO1D9]
MVKASTTEAIEALAAEIGENVYLDLANWHLYLSDAHLAWAVAEQIYPMLVEHSLDESKVVQILAKIQVSLGGGKENIPLINLIPTNSQVQLMDLLEEYQRQIA